jgi:hypothetical protein
MKIIALHRGSDWSDASADYLILPKEMDFEAEKRAQAAWYSSEYCAASARGERPEYISIIDWLIRRGAVEPTIEQLEIIYI